METGLLPLAAPETNQALTLAQVAHGFLPNSGNAPKLVHEMLNDVYRIIENVRSAAKPAGVQVIGIASAQPNEGTSTLATMIALMMTGSPNGSANPVAAASASKPTRPGKPGRVQHGVALLDTQWQHPSLHKIFGMPVESGLSELLTGEISAEFALKNVPLADLSLVTAGQKGHVTFTNHFYLEKLRSFLEEIKPVFEFVFLDLPSLLHSVEGIALSKLCDGIILVVRANQTRWEVVEEAKRLLEKSNVNILGAVLNRRNFYIPKELYRRL